MSPWPIAVWAMLPAFAIPVLVALRGDMATRLVAAQLATVFASLLLALMSYAFDQDSYLDLALTLGILSLPGSLVMAHFIERWL